MKNTSKLFKRITSGVVACAMLLTSVPPVDIHFSDWDIHLGIFDTINDYFFESTAITAYAEMETDNFDQPGTEGYKVEFNDGIRSVEIKNADQLIEYSICYRDFPSHNHDTDIITLNPDSTGALLMDLISNNTFDSYGGFQSIGNDTKPFKGAIHKTGVDTITMNIDKPFFGTVEQSVVVDFPMTLSRVTQNLIDNSPLLATKIQNTNSEDTSFSVTIVLDGQSSDESAVVKSYSGVIGTIDNSTSVALAVTNNLRFNNANANVNASGNVGFLCCEMGTDSILDATINNGSNNNYSVSSTSGNAGGLVGEMANGSKLIIDGTGFKSITQSVTGTYAGGLVGKATGAYIGTSDITRASDATEIELTITDCFKATATTLSGSTASGYLFGYYENVTTTLPASDDIAEQSISNRKFTIDSTFRNVSLTFNSNNAGGYFGVLNNNVTGGIVTFDGGVADVSANLNDNTNTLLKSNFNGKSNLGGVAYKYKANALENSFFIENTYAYNAGNVVNYGGAVCTIDDTASAAYIRINNYYTRQPKTASTSGGLVYSTGSSHSSFIDVSGYIRINGSLQGGLIYSMPKGVLRLAGTTNLSSVTADGLIVKERTNGLVYSKGSANDDGNGSSWKLIRNTASIDDVYTWGEVVRLTESGDIKTSSEDTNTDFIIDESSLATDHSITVPDFNVGAISGRDDLIRLALHIQLKTGDSPTDTSATGSALVMEGSDSTTILGNNITIASSSTSPISLSGTGITGLTRDDGTNDRYTGTFNGNNKTITLAIGEAYGYKSDGTNLAVNTNGNDGSTGRIYRHDHNGLFAKLGSGAAINNLTVDGQIYLGNNVNQNHYTGGFGASIEAGTISFSNDTSSIEVYLYKNQKLSFTGGFVSRIADNGVTLNFTDCTSDVEFYDNSGRGDEEIFFGGFVSMISKTSKNVELNFDTDTNNNSTTGCNISGKYKTASNDTTTSYTAVSTVKYGGLIGYVENDYDNSIKNPSFKEYWNTRKININKLSIDNLEIKAKVKDAGSNNPYFGCAALLGYEWYGLDVTIADLSVGTNSACSIYLTSDSRENVKMAGLCTICTGHWQVDKVDINRLDVTGRNSSFGMLVNSAFRPKNDKGMPAMYLELTDVTNYTISSDSKVSISGIADGLYDELAVYTYCVGTSGQNVITNGNSIISINTDSTGTPLIMTGNGCNTYQNQTEYGKSITTHNTNSRYYYNIYSIRNKVKAGTATTAEKFLLWSIVQYAYNTETFKSYFYNTYSNGTLSNSRIEIGTLDMTGLSYYPFNHTSDWTFKGATTLTFCNEQIEAGENLSGGDDLPRTTSGTDSAHTQHYMMHCGLFRDFVTGNKTINTHNLTLKGSVGIYNGGSGFIVSGTLGGANSTINFKPNGNNGGNKTYTISLDGAYVYNPNSADYAPLLINNVQKNTTIHLYGVKTTDNNSVYSTKQANDTWCAATSLIGKVGDANASSINLDFYNIVLDSRKANGNLSTDSELNTAYRTSRSIFSRATLLHYFMYSDNNSGGTYNYTYAEDWPSSGSKHQVTYGQEVTYTIDNNDDYPENPGDYTDYSSSQQLHYSGDSTHWTSPVSGSATAMYNFSDSGFLPYVGDYNKKTDGATTLTTDTHDTKYHELDVNLSVSSLNEGCGTYNDPYVIREVGQFLALAKLLKGETLDPLFMVNLPNSIDTTLKTDTGDRNLHWCTGNSDHTTFIFRNNVYRRATHADIDSIVDANNATTSNTYTTDQVRKYLAGAYYQVVADCTLSTKFPGLGVGDSNNSGAYSFHGVIVGKQGSLPKLDGSSGNETRYPHIKNKSASPLIVASNGSVIKNVGIDVLNVSKTTTSISSTSSATFEYNAGCDSYGAVIGKIMGGDNVIDNVPVTFTNTTFVLNDGAQVVPFGGYVGVVLNGGLFFRNMSGDNISGLASSSSTTETLASGVTFKEGNTAKSDVLSSSKYLYINPIIGRVINGYAVTESTTYKPAETNVTMKNNRKNYSIADILTTDTVTIGTDSITADSAQDLFILSLIVNSGTGSKASALSYDKTTFKTTHIGTYTDVGCKQTKKKLSTDSGDNPVVCDTALFASGYTELTDASATPYITVKYTNSSANAQVLTDSDKSYAISISGSPWTMPDGYRGIGGFNSGNSGYQLGVTSMNSGGSAFTINLNSEYNTYVELYENYKTAPNCGFGLFNTFVPSSGCTIEKITFSGKVKTTAYEFSGNTGTFPDIDANTKDTRTNYLSAGMLAGVKANANAFSLNTLTINHSGSGAGVSSFRNAGGIIGNLSGSGTVTVTGCNGTNLIVSSAGHTGGFFGKSESPLRINSASGTSTVTISDITQSNGSAADNWTANNSAGGLIGYDADSIIKNVTISPVSGGTGIVLSSTKGGAGGLIGTSVPGVSTNVIDNCTISDLPVTGRRTGAVVGQYAPSNVRTVSITNVTVNGKTGSGSKAALERTTSGDVGTIIGTVIKANVTIENCNSKNYIIKSGGDSVGGCVGYVGESSTINLKNYLIDSCEFQSSAQNTGGIIGGLGGSSSQVLGYNIAMNSITSTGTKYAADFVGSYSNKILRIVGFSRHSTPTPTTASNYTTVCSNAVCVSGTTQTELPEGSYIIFADYNGKGYDSSVTPNIANYSKIKQRTNSGTDENPVYEYSELITDFANARKSPYVLINPYMEIDAYTKLTGDGIANSKENLAINSILSGITNGDSNAYTYPGISFDTTSISTMNTQLGAGTVANDFAILVLEDTNHNNSNSLINGYLQLLTNTQFEYADNTTNSTIYSTKLYKMELENGKFVKSEKPSNLKIDNYARFYMMNDKDNVDTGLTTMFSLIDIQFYDPTDSSANPEVAYHLYVPVLVKKMLKYSFKIATGSGTIYDKTWYGDPGDPTSRYQKTLLENLGTPGTLYFTFTYERTCKEWQEALEAGENLLINYDKILTMKEPTAALPDISGSTRLVLVDTNQNNKCYYSTFSSAWNDDRLTMYKNDAESPTFKSSYASTGTAFVPIALCELMNISVSENSVDGKFVRLTNSTDAKVKVGEYYYRPYDSTVDIGDNAPDTRYDLTFINKKGVDTPVSNNTPVILSESYYLSFFTQKAAAGTVNYYQITSPTQITGGEAAVKAVNLQSALLLYGDLYTQSNITVQANPYPSDPLMANPPLITDSNNMVRTKLQTSVSLTSTATSYGIDAKLDESVNIYQSFIVYLTKHTGSGDVKGIVGKPRSSAEYTISPITASETYKTQHPTGSQRNELNYVEAASGVSLTNYLRYTDGATITAELVLYYDTPDQRNAQFPIDTSSLEPEYYATVSASSNVAYDASKTAYSKNQITGNDINNIKYHIDSGKEAKLQYNAMADDNGNPYGQLGINANDLDNNSGKVKIKTNAVYSLKDVSDDVPISEYKYVKFTFKLSQKQKRSSAYGSALQIGNYLKDVEVKGTGITTATRKKFNDESNDYVAATDTDTEYSFILNRSELMINGDPDSLSIPVEFEVYTGSSLQAKGYMYGNFKIEVSAQCLKKANDKTGNANASNYIVYTNAKLLTDFIDAS